MPTTIPWNTPASGDWNTGTNWTGGAVPPATDDALIGLSGTYDVTIAGGETETIAGVSITNTAATLLLDGLLVLNGTLSGAGVVQFASGTIAGGTIANGSDLAFTNAFNVLAGVTVDGGLQVGTPAGFGEVVLTAATTVYAADGVSPGTITLGNATGSGADIYFQNTRTIENTITAGAASEAVYIDAGGTFSGGIYPLATLTLGSQFVLQGGTGDSFTFRDNGSAVGFADVVNQGTINAGPTGDLVYVQTQGFTNAGLMTAAAPGDVLYVENSSANAWFNTGTISVSGGGNAYLGGQIDAIGTLVHSGTGDIYITGTVENAGLTTDAAGSLNGVLFQNGMLQGGTVLHGSDLAFTNSFNVLTGVTVDGGLQVGTPAGFGEVVLTATTTVYAEDGVSPGTITLGNAAGSGADIYFQNTRTIENTITAGAASEAMYIDAGGTFSGGIYPLATLTLGSQFVLQGGTGDSFTFRDNGSAVGFADVVNQGTINAGPTGDVVYVQTQGFTNAGLMTAAAPGDVLYVENSSANAWFNTGTISVSGGGNAYLGGQIDAIGTLVHSGTGDIYITGTVENAGLTTDAAGSLNGVLFQNGMLQGGTVLHGSDLAFTNSFNVLTGVTVDGGLQVGTPAGFGEVVLTATTTVYAEDGVSPGTITLGNAAGSGADIYFQNTRTIENTITAGAASEAMYIDAGGTFSGGIYPLATLTLGSQFVLQGGTGDSFTFRDNGSAVGFADVVNQGTINAGPTGDVVYVQTQGFTNAGLMTAAAPGDVLYVENSSANAWFNTGTISVSGGGNAYLGGQIDAIGTLAHSGTGDIYITGTVENAGLTTDAAGSLNGVLFQNGTLQGGTVLHGSDLAFTNSFNVLTGVTVDGGLQVGTPAGFGEVVLTATTTVYAEDGVSPGTITLGNATGSGADIYFQNTRTIENFITAGGTGEALYIDAGGTFSGGVYPQATLTLGSQFVLQGGTNDSFTFRDNGAAVGYADLINQGTINTSGPGDKVYIQTQGFTNNGLVVGSGVVDNPVNDGVIESIGLMQLQGSVTGSGTLQIDAGATMQVGTVAAGQTALFAGPGAVLDLLSPTQFAGTLTNLAAGDTITLEGTVATSATIIGNTLAITLQAASPMQVAGTLDFALITPAAGDVANIEAGGREVVITSNAVTCFLAGTRIATPRGEVAVEQLAPGDDVLTVDGAARPVRWIGHRTVQCARHPRPWQVLPVRIAAHAFGRGCPGRALFLSPDHAVFTEGVLIPVKHLINGTTVRQVRVKQAAYYHIELDQHAVLLAEGLPAESYLDTGDRDSFANGGAVAALHPAWGGEMRDVAAVFEALGAAPLRVVGPEIERAQARLAERQARGSASGLRWGQVPRPHSF